MYLTTEQDMIVEETSDAPAPRRWWVFWLVGGVLTLALLGGAAYMAGRLLQGEPLPLSPAALMAGPGGDKGGGTFALSVEMIPAEELPDRDADMNGLFVRRDGNSLYIQQVVENMVKGGVVTSGGEGEPSMGSGPEAAGPEIEIVITADTIIYRDATELPLPGEAQGEQTIQQQVEQVDSIEEIGADTMIRVWGVRRGDRIIAEVLFYTRPLIMEGPGK